MTSELVRIHRSNRLWVLGIPAMIGVAVLVIMLLQPRRYEGAVVVAPVNNGETGGKTGLATMLGGISEIGLHSTPILVGRLARLDGVLLSVAHEPVNQHGLRIADVLTHESAGAVDDVDALAAMRKAVSANADNVSGLVTIRVTARDTALVRLIVRKLLAQTARSFENATRSQATALKHAQDRNVDTAMLRLRRAEDTYREFASKNRVSNVYTEASVQARRLERELKLAEDVYAQAVTQREAAAARELETIPVLVVVDDLPANIRPTSRGIALNVILWTLVALTITLALNSMRNRQMILRQQPESIPSRLTRHA